MHDATGAQLCVVVGDIGALLQSMLRCGRGRGARVQLNENVGGVIGEFKRVMKVDKETYG